MRKAVFVHGLIIFSILTGMSCIRGHYTKWEYNRNTHNIEFSKIRYGIADNDTIVIIGFLKSSTWVEGYLCEADWVHFTKDWKLIMFKMAETKTINNFQYPQNAWIHIRNNTIICSLPHDTVIQGYLCRGNGGPKGIQTSIYPNGQLESFFTKGNIKINEINCKGGVFSNIVLYDDGRLKECTLSEEQSINKIKFKKGVRIHFDESGKCSEKQ